MKQLALLGAALLLGSCGTLSLPTPVTSYVALGDSITAGYQSGSLTAEGQRSSYAVLFGQRAGIIVNSPEGKAPGCPPPAGTAPSADSCVRANPDQVVSNFAVPGAKLADVLYSSVDTVRSVSPQAAALYNLILGAQDTQVSAAVKARAQFLTVWIGANDVLGATLGGNPAGATPTGAFENTYAKLLDALQASGSVIVPFTVPDVSSIPNLVPGPRLYELKLADASCQSSVNKISAAVLADPRVSKPLNCADTTPYVLTPAKLKTAADTVSAYNASIRKLAVQRGMRVLDVNPILKTLVTTPFDPGSAQPFGPDFSQDGVHPSTAAHQKFAQTLAQFFNTSFGTGTFVN